MNPHGSWSPVYLHQLEQVDGFSIPVFLLHFLRPSPWGKKMEMTHLKQMLGSVYGYPPPRNLIFGNIFVQSYTQPESEAACCCPVSSKLVLHRECKAREVLRKCTSWIKPAKNIHGASEDRGILCLVTDNSWTKRNWLALITACLPSGCCRASCSKAPSRIWQVAANES